MKRRAVRFFVFVLTVLIAFSGIHAFAVSYTEYKCDVKNIRLVTTIEIEKDNEEFAKVKGEIRLVTDPLTMYDLDDNKIAYAGDSYRFVAQDAHAIYVDGMLTCDMVGLVDWWGESYDIYDKDENKIAEASFNDFNTSGKIFDMDGNKIAEYSSNYFFNDFDVRIYEGCELDEKTVLMIFCSYYSDQHADN